MARLAVVPELEQELDRLYGLPLDDFTAARNELASRLKRAGQEDVAERVRALKKPSVPVWAVNQLARREPEGVRAIVDAGARLRKAQEAALRGGPPDDVRAATRDEREALRRLTRAAEALLREEGRPATGQTVERINATLRAAAVDPQAAEVLAAGRLAEEVESSGFAALAGIAPAEATPRRRRPADDRTARREHEQRLRRLRREAEAAERRAVEAEKEVERLARGLADARERAREAKKDARAAAKAVLAEERR